MSQSELTEKQTRRISKFMSYVLRHHPGKIGIELDENGWIAVDLLLQAFASQGREISRATLDYVVRTNNKKRFQYSEDGCRIRATQGHSINVDLGYEPAEPPEYLYHGTYTKAIGSIRATGLTRQQRHHVHLHLDKTLAVDVGSRRGQPVLLVVRSKEMSEAGHEFFVTPNGVWLTERVPPEFIEFPE